MSQGDVKCSLCKSPGTNKVNCPLNPDAKHPNPIQHPQSRQQSAQGRQRSNLSSYSGQQLNVVVSVEIISQEDKEREIYQLPLLRAIEFLKERVSNSRGQITLSGNRLIFTDYKTRSAAYVTGPRPALEIIHSVFHPSDWDEYVY